ncbi:TetR-like C-terminal domain-containing protein [Modestobacter sp. VKM Ac-2980]|uniref:TetR-like C-terminal domain-containing protein n=1 Tax=unclassified Modestobacter TaxID=2643866 RepID=UPI003FA59863
MSTARDFPERYRLMFGGVWEVSDTDDEVELEERARVGRSAFNVLVEALDACSEAGVSDSSDPFTDATALWVALHGMAGLRQTAPLFPWPSHLDDLLIRSLARLS